MNHPFTWGFNEQRMTVTLAKQMNAQYNKPCDTLQNKKAIDNFFEQNVAPSPNPAFINGLTPLEVEPYLVKK